MERIDTPRGRFYRITDDLLLPSVTTVLGVINKDLTPWALRECSSYVRRNVPLDGSLTRERLDEVLVAALRQPTERLDAACAFGTEAHEHAARYVTDGLVPDWDHLDPKMASWIWRFKRWWDASGLTCLLSEQLVWSEEFAYAGTLDALATDAAGKLYILDWKSSNTLCGAGNYILQAVAYKMALWEQAELILPDLFANEIATADILVVRFGKRDRSVDVLHVDQIDHASYFRAFMAARTLFDWTMDSDRIVEKALRGSPVVPPAPSPKRD